MIRINVHWVQTDDDSPQFPVSIFEGLNVRVADSIRHLYGPNRHLYALVCHPAQQSAVTARLTAERDVDNYFVLPELPR